MDYLEPLLAEFVKARSAQAASMHSHHGTAVGAADLAIATADLAAALDACDLKTINDDQTNSLP
jgi:hypothetical protein